MKITHMSLMATANTKAMTVATSSNDLDLLLEENLFARLEKDVVETILDRPGPYVYIDLSPEAVVITTATGETTPAQTVGQKDGLIQTLDATLNLSRRVFASKLAKSFKTHAVITQLIIRTSAKRTYFVIPDVVKELITAFKRDLLDVFNLQGKITSFARLNPRVNPIVEMGSLPYLCASELNSFTKRDKSELFTFSHATDPLSDMKLVSAEGVRDLRDLEDNTLSPFKVHSDLVIPLTSRSTMGSMKTLLAIAQRIAAVKEND